MSNTATVAGGQSLTITRRVRATPEEVFDAWLDADGMRTWMVGSTLGQARATIDARVGGKFRLEMFKPDNTGFDHTGEYLTIDRPRKLAFTWFSLGTKHQRTVVTIELEPVGDGETKLTLTHQGLPSVEDAVEHEQGWGIVLGKLAEALSS
ncbi:MAG TPA: SRPBCC domain-containing protein [Gemmatimonadaceae bacterium]